MTPVHHQQVSGSKRTHARTMRRAPTDAEQKMWRLLRDRRFAGIKFRRQVPFQNFILDFVCLEKRVVVEIDGSQHADSAADRARDRALRKEGFRTLRYWNNDVLKYPNAVLEDIFARISAMDVK
jgi:very-short-patch-repair endonuclease